jgi:transposase
VIGVTEVPANSPKLAKAIKDCQERGKIFAAYEAGCLGFDVYHFPEKQGIAARLANTVFRPGDEKKIKTDRRDAALIARMLKRGEASATKLPRGYIFPAGRNKRRGTLFGGGGTWQAT